jgi:hypothetical protein
MCALLLVACFEQPSVVPEGDGAHIHSFDAWEVTRNPTCTQQGEKVRYCSCGEMQSGVIAETGHSFGEWVVTKQPSCEASGESMRYCACGETQSRVVAETGHALGGWEIVAEATCRETGEKVQKCQRCDYFLREMIACKTHEYQTTAQEQPTCKQDGNVTQTCALCGDVKSESVAASGHAWLGATCTTPKTCTTCGVTEGEALGHSSAVGKCTRCGQTVAPTVHLPSLPTECGVIGHNGFITKMTVTSIEYTFETLGLTGKGFELEFTVAGEKTYDREGTEGRGYVTLVWKLLDDEGYVVCSNLLSVFDFSVGEKFKNQKIRYTAYDIEPSSSYTLVLEDYK